MRPRKKRKRPTKTQGKTVRLILGQAPRELFDPETAARLVEQVALAVAAVHKGTRGSTKTPRQPLVHRDLKPENILLDEHGNAHVADFGLAAAVADLHEGSAGAGGTPAYMSPEQATAFQSGTTTASIDTRSDVWALGVILYELLTGKKPFTGNNRDEILHAILCRQYEPTRPRDLRPDIPPALETLVSECLKKDVDERIQSAEEVATRLRRWLDSVSAIPAPLDFSARLEEAHRDFSDRPWLFDEVDAWTAHQNQRLLLLTGELGSGKSAFLAELIHRDQQRDQQRADRRIVAWHLCRFDWPESRSAAKFVRSLAGMLASRIEGYRKALEDLAVREALRLDNCETDPDSAFETGVVTPLANAKRPGDGVYFVVVDALDEADLSTEPSIPKLLAQWANQAPDWLRIIVSVRRGAIDEDILAGHGVLAIDRENDVHGDDVRDDIRRFVDRRLGDPNLEERLTQCQISIESAAKALVEKSEDNFLYVVEALTAIERDKFTFQELDTLPPGLSAFYAGFFRRQWPNRDSFARVRPVIEVLVAAREPLDEDLIVSATGLNIYGLADCLDPLAQYLDRRSHHVRLRHHALVKWLTTTKGKYRAAAREGHKKLADACYAQFTDEVDSMTDYSIRHLPAHLAKAQRWDDLHTVLTSIEFLQRKAEEGHATELLADLGLLDGDKRNKSKQRRELTGLLAHALRLDLSFIASHPESLFQSLYNRCWWHGGQLKELMNKWRQKQSGQPWIRSLRPPAEPLEGPLICRLTEYTGAVLDVAVTSDGQKAASADGTIRIWDLPSGECLSVLRPDNIKPTSFQMTNASTGEKIPIEQANWRRDHRS